MRHRKSIGDGQEFFRQLQLEVDHRDAVAWIGSAGFAPESFQHRFRPGPARADRRRQHQTILDGVSKVTMVEVAMRIAPTVEQLPRSSPAAGIAQTAQGTNESAPFVY